MTRNYATKFIFSLILITILLFSLFQTILGEKGVMVNRYLSRQIAQLDEQYSDNEAIIETLEKKSNSIKSPEYITQIMNNVGYVQEGQSLYILPQERKIEDTVVKQTPPLLEEGPKTLSVFTNILLSFSLSLLIHLLLFILNKRKRKTKDQYESDYES